jgi:hypothetical protein
MATDFEGMVPRSVSSEFLEAIARESIVLELANVQRMSEATQALPIVSFMPQAKFTSSRYGGRKPATKIEWSHEELVPAEIAATLAIPENWIGDAGFDVWGNVRPTLVTALSRLIDDAILFGNGEPPGWLATGVVGAVGDPVEGADALAAIDAGFSQVEESGFDVTGIGSRVSIKSAIRQEYRVIGETPATVPTLAYAGVPIVTSPEWDTTIADALVGDWRYLLVGVREDISFRTSDDAILQDDAGEIIANSFQDNLVALKVWMKLGYALGTPVLPDNSGNASAFAAVDWTA